jgi:hypothetical protein
VMWRSAGWQKSTDFSEDKAASIVRVDDYPRRQQFSTVDQNKFRNRDLCRTYSMTCEDKIIKLITLLHYTVRQYKMHLRLQNLSATLLVDRQTPSWPPEPLMVNKRAPAGDPTAYSHHRQRISSLDTSWFLLSVSGVI